LITAIPWFGTHDWETMYDWPAHRITMPGTYRSQMSGPFVKPADRIAKKQRHHRQGHLSHSRRSRHDNPSKLGLDPDLYKKYASLCPIRRR
jgi:hypothetical protein